MSWTPGILLLFLIGFTACGNQRPSESAPAEFAGKDKPTAAEAIESVDIEDPDLDDEEDESFERELDAFEAGATESGRLIFSTARSMIRDGVIVLGSCWDYINAVYNRAGITGKKRVYVFKSSKKGPFADLDQVQTGDWLYIINHSYGDVEHSGIFVGWTDREKNEAMMVSYVGGNRNSPGRYDYYDLTHVYTIIRATPESK